MVILFIESLNNLTSLSFFEESASSLSWSIFIWDFISNTSSSVRDGGGGGGGGEGGEEGEGTTVVVTVENEVVVLTSDGGGGGAEGGGGGGADGKCGTRVLAKKNKM